MYHIYYYRGYPMYKGTSLLSRIYVVKGSSLGESRVQGVAQSVHL